MLWALLITLGAGVEPNLLRNPGFEQVTARMPEHWNVFVKEYGPLEQSDAPPQGAVDTIAREGRYSAFLHNPVPYRSEPCNNWSQVVWGDLAGKKLRLAGAVKAEDATSVALWVQCWQRTPYKLLSVATSGDRTPIGGTIDWTQIEMNVDVPPETGFVMVRCVLRGKGKAWFDDLSLREVIEPPKQEEPAPFKPEHPETTPIPTPKANEMPDVKELKSVADSLHSFSKTNQDLLQEVESLQQEIQGLREQLKTLQEAAANVETPPERPPAPSTPQHVPPLVPHGFKVEDLP